MFMHKAHWYMLPKVMRDEVWALYTPGQERRKDPSHEYLLHVRKCINYVWRKEHKDCPDCSNHNKCCMEHNVHVDSPKPHVGCILR